MFKFFLILTKDGRTRCSRYYDDKLRLERVLIEAEIARKCLQRKANQCTFMEYHDFKVVFRRYASLFFVAGVDLDENDIAISEFIHNIVETMNSYFKNVCELDIMLHIDKVYMMLDEMIINGEIAEPRKEKVLAMLRVLDSNS